MLHIIKVQTHREMVNQSTAFKLVLSCQQRFSRSLCFFTLSQLGLIWPKPFSIGESDMDMLRGVSMCQIGCEVVHKILSNSNDSEDRAYPLNNSYLGDQLLNLWLLMFAV